MHDCGWKRPRPFAQGNALALKLHCIDNINLISFGQFLVRFMGPPFDEMAAAHIKTIWASSKGNHDEAWQYQNMCVQAFIKGFNTSGCLNRL